MIVYGLINDQSSIHMLTEILLEINNMNEGIAIRLERFLIRIWLGAWLGLGTQPEKEVQNVETQRSASGGQCCHLNNGSELTVWQPNRS